MPCVRSTWLIFKDKRLTGASIMTKAIRFLTSGGPEGAGIVEALVARVVL